jgi:DHA1 family bicyclomycin/chloramphenicol resistance-like MFS transporter
MDKTMTGDNPIQNSCTDVTKTAVMTPTTVPPRLTTLILLSALSVLPVNMILPSLPNIAATFHADFALVNLSVAGYANRKSLLGVQTAADMSFGMVRGFVRASGRSMT